MPFGSPVAPIGEAQPPTFSDPDSITNNAGPIRKGSTGRSSLSATAKRRGRAIPTIIIHDNALLRAGLAHILAETQFRVQTQCSSSKHLPQRALAGDQCLALIGIDGSDPGAILSEISYLKSQGAHVHVIVLGEQLRVPNLLALIAAGADGYLLVSEFTAETLLRCLDVVVLGSVVVPRASFSIREEKAASHSDASALIESVSSRHPVGEAPQSAELSRLSNREQTILRQLMQGASNKHIARSLEIAEATVKVHVKSLLRKLQVANRTQAAMWATSHFRNVSASVTASSGVTQESQYTEEKPNAGGGISCQKGAKQAFLPDQPDVALDLLSVDLDRQQATGKSISLNGESLTIQTLPASGAENGEHRGLINVPIAAPRIESLSPLVMEVVRYLRQQDDVVVHQGNGMFLVNGRFHLRTSELVDKANRIRQRQNKPLFN